MSRSRTRRNKKKKLSSSELQRKILKQFIRQPKKRYNARLLASKIKASNSKDAYQHALNILEKEGKIFQLPDNKYRLDKYFTEQQNKKDNTNKIRQYNKSRRRRSFL